MAVIEHLYWAIGADHQQAGRLFAACKERQQIKSRDITPMQVLQHQNHRLFRS